MFANEILKVGTLPTQLQYFGSVLTIDEQYILIFGGMDHTRKQQKLVWIMDLDTFSVTTSKIQIPPKNSVNPRAVIVNDKKRRFLLVSGYLRTFYDESLSDDIAKLMAEWCIQGDVHLLASDNTHWSINVSHIFNQE